MTMSASPEDFDALAARVRACCLCDDLPLGAKPLFQVHPDARILVVGQAPGRLTHVAGRPFDDASGVRLRRWLGVDEQTFYDARKFAFIPMGLCYPGRGNGGDLPPRPVCSEAWRGALLSAVANVRLTILVGAYAHKAHLGADRKSSLSATVEAWREYWPDVLPIPHPSGRNTAWLKNRPWFEADVVPQLQERVQMLLGGE